MIKYIIRLDDACPNMNIEKWLEVEKILDKFNLFSIVGVIPDNKDSSFKFNLLTNIEFWDIVRKWENKNWSIAMHGYQHLYVSNSSGIFNIHNRSEFAGLPYEEQKNKIINGYNIFLQNGIKPKIWMAPSHTFDEITLQVLKEFTDIRIITDGFFKYPCYYKDFLFIPQQIWKFKKPLFNGIYTICLHPNEMNQKDFKEMEMFIANNRHFFINNLKDLENYTGEICKKNFFYYYHYLNFKLKQFVLRKIKGFK